MLEDTGFFYSENDIFGSSKPLLSMNKDDYIVLPKTADFEDTVSTISYDTESEDQAVLITYTYHDVFIGSASLDFVSDQTSVYSFDNDSQTDEGEDASQGSSVIFVNVVKVSLWILGIAAVLIFIIGLGIFVKTHQFSGRSNRFSWLLRRRRRPGRKQAVNATLRRKRQTQIRRAKRRRRKNIFTKYRDYD